jgi:hypothetical protein
MDAKGKMDTATQLEQSGVSPDAIRIRLLLEEERKSFMNSIKSEFQAYLAYKFEAEATSAQLKNIHDQFANFEKSPIPESLIKSVLKDGQTGYNWFYEEVNKIIRSVLAPARIDLNDNSKTKEGIDMTDLNSIEG